MKYFYLTIALFFSLSSYSQNDLLGEWFLQSIIVDGIQENDVPNHASINFTTQPGDGNGLYFDGLGACNGFTGGYLINSNDSFDIVVFYQTLVICDTADEGIFENKYFYHVLNTEIDRTNMQYTITGTGPGTTLTLTNTITNNSAVYGKTPQIYLLGEWYLHYIIDLDVPVYNADYPNMKIVFSEDMGNLSVEGTSSCNTFNGLTTSVQPNYFTALPPLWTELDCTGDSLYDETGFYLEQVYKNFLYYNYDDINFTSTRFDYNISGSEDDSFLEIYNVTYDEESETNIGYFAVFGRQTLSINESILIDFSIHLKENPVRNELKLKLEISQSLANKFNYIIFSTDGKQLAKGKLSENYAINIESLNSGMYFLAVSSNDNYRQTLKFVKE